MSILEDVFDDLVNHVYSQIKKNKNKKKIKFMLETITSHVFEDINPYLYTIIAIIVLTFLMNCIVFYWYITRKW
jgi:hypothetical protein